MQMANVDGLQLYYTYDKYIMYVVHGKCAPFTLRGNWCASKISRIFSYLKCGVEYNCQWFRCSNSTHSGVDFFFSRFVPFRFVFFLLYCFDSDSTAICQKWMSNGNGDEWVWMKIRFYFWLVFDFVAFFLYFFIFWLAVWLAASHEPFGNEVKLLISCNERGMVYL